MLSKEFSCGGGMKAAVPPGAEDCRIVEEGAGDGVKDDGGCWDFGTDNEGDDDVSDTNGEEEEKEAERRLLEPGPDAGGSGELTRNTDMDDVKALETAAAVTGEGGDEVNSPPPPPVCWSDDDDESGAMAMDVEPRRLAATSVDVTF
ncbi:hypothetical protein BGZ91_011386 [Linnemannia elongata]|nr:hypothetical protein BGZ91_011386 [Linnemannia elongata]